MHYFAKLLLTFTTTISSFTHIAAQLSTTNATSRLASMQAKASMLSTSTITTPFKNIGPTVMSGRVVDVEVNPTDPTELYVAYATGGLWHTTNNGQSFVPIIDSVYTTYGIGDIAVNWKTNPRILWVGTGEVNSSRSSYAGVGMYCSIDSGRTWQHKGLEESHHIGKVLLHPTNASIAWVAVLGHLYTHNTDRGMYRTTNGGTTWSKVLYINDSTGAVDIDIDALNPNILYATMWQKTRTANQFVGYGTASGIYKSTDGGIQWSLISGVASGFPQGEKIGRIGITTYPLNSNILYAVVDNNNTKPALPKKKKDSTYSIQDFNNLDTLKFAQLSTKWLDTFLVKNGFDKKYTATQIKNDVRTGKLMPSCIQDYFDSDDGFQNTGIYGCQVYRSNNGGSTWLLTNDTLLAIYNTYGYYFGKIYVSPTNANKVYILGFKAQMSTNGGKTFKTIDKENVHPDHHALWINPAKDSHIINGNDGGLCISYDDGKHWYLANSPAVGQFYAITTDDAKPYNVYGGLQDNGVWYSSSKAKMNNAWLTDGHNPYTSINGGDGMQVQVDTRDNKTVYSGYQFGSYSRQVLNGGTDDVSVQPEHDLGEKPLRFNWQTPILLSRYNQDIFYIGANKLYRSFNKGNKLLAISPDLTQGKVAGNVPYGTITTIAESPMQYGLLYVGTDDGNVHITQDAGITWNKISTTLPQGLWVSRIVASEYVKGRVYTTLSGYRKDDFAPYAYISNDYGKTWATIHNGLPLESINVIREDPKKPNIIYIGTDGGLYVSKNNGTTYTTWHTGLPKSVAIHDIHIQARENEILLGTHGRSIYVAPLSAVQK